MSNRTKNQIRRQDSEHRENGRYAKVNPCYLCGKSAGQDYCSDRRTDMIDSAGNNWGDIALVLCAKCAKKLDAMPDAEAYALLAGESITPQPIVPAHGPDARFDVYITAPGRDWVCEQRGLTADQADILIRDLMSRNWTAEARLSKKSGE